MKKTFLVIVLVFYVVGTLSVGGSYVYAHWGSGWNVGGLLLKGAGLGLGWPIRLLEKLT